MFARWARFLHGTVMGDSLRRLPALVPPEMDLEGESIT
jgi:hypothetical protein